MADIVQVGSDKRLQLGKEELVWKLPWGAGWSRLRISAWASTTSVGALANGQLQLGVCAGIYGYNSPSCVDAVIAAVNRPEGGSAWNAAGSPAYYYASTTGVYWAWKQNGSIQLSGTSATAVPAMWADGVKLTHFASDFYRMNCYGTGTIWVTAWASTGSNIVPPTADPADNYMYLMAPEFENGPLYSQTSGSQNLAVGYTGAGQLDSICVAWNRASPPMQISLLNVIRFAS